MNGIRLSFLACVMAYTVLSAQAQGPEPIGAEFAVNSIESAVLDASIAASPAGDFVVVWQSILAPDPPDPRDELPIDNDAGVHWRYFKAPGVPLRPGQYQLNTYTTGMQGVPDAATDAFGNFTVVWRSAGSDGSHVVSGQRFGVSSQQGDLPFGGEVELNAANPGIVGGLGDAVIADNLYDDFGFVVVWPGLQGIFGRRLGFDEITNQIVGLGDNFVVSTENNASYPDVAVGDNGEFVVVWEGAAYPGTIQARRFDALAVPRGEAFRVDATPGGGIFVNEALRPTVGMAPDSSFVVFWSRKVDVTTPSMAIFGQRYASNGDALGGEFVVKDDPTTYGIWPSVAVDRDGRFTVVWEQRLPTPGILGRSYLASGQPIGDVFQLDTAGGDIYRVLSAASIAVDAEGDLFVSWTDALEDIQVRLFEAPSLFFADGFESGDTSSWSSRVP